MDRFDLEQQIMDCWQITDDLKVLTEYVLEHGEEALNIDTVANITIGLQQLYNLKFDKMFRTFEVLLKKEIIKDSSDGTLF
jgi:hypothetical protein